MSNVVTRLCDFEKRQLDVLFVHRCRAKTYAGIARLLNKKYLTDFSCRIDEEDFYSADDICDMIRKGFLEIHDGYIYVLGWC